jgi:hypothetical protein
MDEDKPKPPPLEAVVPKSLPGFDVVRAVEPPGLKAQDTPQVRHGAALSKWVLSIISGSIILLITYLVWGEYAIGRDIHELYDHALTTNSTSGESQSLGQLEQLIGDLATARRAQPSAMTTAPAVMSRPPMRAGGVSFSPSSSQAKSMTRGTLSLSSGATREAGPSCRARK